MKKVQIAIGRKKDRETGTLQNETYAFFSYCFYFSFASSLIFYVLFSYTHSLVMCRVSNTLNGRCACKIKIMPTIYAMLHDFRCIHNISTCVFVVLSMLSFFSLLLMLLCICWYMLSKLFVCAHTKRWCVPVRT